MEGGKLETWCEPEHQVGDEYTSIMVERMKFILLLKAKI